MDTPSTSIGPGLGAFVAFFALAVVLWLLMRNMNGRMRRMAYREQQRIDDLEVSKAVDAPRPAKRGKRRATGAPRAPSPQPMREPEGPSPSGGTGGTGGTEGTWGTEGTGGTDQPQDAADTATPTP